MNGEEIELTTEESAFIGRFTAEKCVPHATVIARRLDRWLERAQESILSEPTEWRLAAAGGILPPLKPSARLPESPDEPVHFVFASDSETPGKAWRAELRIPPKASVGTSLPVRVSGIGIDAVPEGVLRLAGCRIPLVRGEGAILFDLFVAGIRDSEVSLTRPDGSLQRGRLLFL